MTINQFPTFADQDAYVRQVCAILLQRMHTVHDVQIANEYWATGSGQHHVTFRQLSVSQR